MNRRHTILAMLAVLASLVSPTMSTFADEPTITDKQRVEDKETGLKITFKLMHGTKPQATLVLADSQLTAAAQKQLDKIFVESGMLETPNFKQTGVAMDSSLFAIDIKQNGKSHHAEIDESSAPPAYAKLIKFIQKHGTKPPTVSKEAEASATVTADATAAGAQ